MEFECWSLKAMFSEDNKAKNTSNELSFSHYFENKFSILGHGKHQKCPGKGHGKSWSFIRSKSVNLVLINNICSSSSGWNHPQRGNFFLLLQSFPEVFTKLLRCYSDIVFILLEVTRSIIVFAKAIRP